ncbi:hypothetical protein B0T18DRAFT_417310 [Schizothecium vesticola]|uniref:Uncharacterized protein n=1 Tax=Schizothecium vesticola TaxID=314040 RepID=A0AA40EIV8_9PEZI|nr:hypothetical protein B0T18DRAFT_417310 [Schizothecium vesticola]
MRSHLQPSLPHKPNSAALAATATQPTGQWMEAMRGTCASPIASREHPAMPPSPCPAAGER